MAKTDAAIKKAQEKVTGTTHQASVTGTQTRKLTNSFGELFGAISTTYDDYIKTLTPRLKLIDLFLVFLVALGILQFVYVLLVGNFPFNAFLGGFISCVGQFVLVVSLRLQVKEPEVAKVPVIEIRDEGEAEPEVVEPITIEEFSTFKEISPERSFGDFIFASLILHFIVYHFIN